MPSPLRLLPFLLVVTLIVGGGHNGLTAAAYLARAGRSCLVLERRDQLESWSQLCLDGLGKLLAK